MFALLVVSCGPASTPAPAAPAEATAPEGPADDPWQPDGDVDAPDEAAAPEAAPPSRATPPARPTPTRALPPAAQAMLDAHNRVRAQHCAAPLTWSPQLATAAQAWANKLDGDGCAFEHSRTSYGENLAAGTTGALPPEAVVAMWYDEVKGYSFAQPGFSMQTGHFTQVVWRATTAVGCGMAQCKGMDLWVCNYDPPGNYERQYPSNVLPVGCRP